MRKSKKKVAELRVDSETGSIVNGFCDDNDISVNYRKNKSKTVFVCNQKECYVEVHVQLLKRMRLFPSEELFAYHLLDFISLNDNILRYQGNLLDIKTIAILFDQEYESTRQVMKRLIDKGVIAKVYLTDDTKKKNYIKVYVFNPFIATKGKRIPGYIFSIFQKFGWGIKQCELYTDKPVTMTEIKDNFYANPEKSYLYILLNNTSGDIKIGVTNNVDRRLIELQTASADILYLGYISPKCDNAYELESKTHEYFSEYRKNGEWFHVNLFIAIGYIESLFDNQEITVQ